MSSRRRVRPFINLAVDGNPDGRKKMRLCLDALDARIKWQSECTDVDWKIRDARHTFFNQCHQHTWCTREIADKKTLVKSNIRIY